ncbi:MAG TPA: hypothetical protein PKO41_02680 [Dokdonella sp.]|uniref:hypothetical protein n=1 Tax=Dokdonella sp. TaxID=2291710 RepID=UPI0025C6EB12|nr:hypothetical protein [Dokdonella sp.]MBX3693029.1 hypothetical protein [Dokdonella sp.]MCW5568841.1 hypothetical protein [Dokdonella sp.]HNR91309.1 hypothetical protein [Dokdonella sp.]
MTHQLATSPPFLALALGLAVLAGCGSPAPPAAATTPTPVAGTTPAAEPRDAAPLRMRIDGAEWVAAHDVFGAVHPTGYDRAILIAGSRGGRNANEQAFNLNLFGIDAPGRYRVTSADPATGAAQIANLDAQRFLAGNLFGYDVTVDVVRLSKNPDRIEARFSGTLTANDGSKVELSEGQFVYDATSAD